MFVVDYDHHIQFHVLGGIDKNGNNIRVVDEWGDFESTTELKGNTKNPIRVFRHVLKLCIEYVSTHKPDTFYFISEEQERDILYKTAADILCKHGKMYTYAMVDGYFYFTSVSS